MSISISRLSKHYGMRQALKEVGFNIGRGEVVGFLGPNGAGKTTVMRILAGSLGYDEGSVRVCGEEVKEAPMKTKQNVGYLPEHNPLYPDMYVKEYLLSVAQMHRLKSSEQRPRVEQLIDLVGLRPEARKKIGQLSKGYRQRVGLAQALIHDPRVLILDEPTTGLDPNQLTEIRNLIRETGKNRTVLFSTHIMQEIEAVCNRVIVINKGEIVADYPDVSQLKNGVQNEYHIEVEFLLPVGALSIASILSLQTSDNKTFRIVAQTDIRQEIFDYAVQLDNKIMAISLLNRSMEDVFRELTAR